MDISINGARILYTIENVPIFGTVHISQTVVVSYLVMAIITALCIWLGSGLKVTGISRKQAVTELAVTSLIQFVRGNMGSGFDRYIPLIGTIFVTSVISNLVSVLGIWSPTADLMTELGWALVVFVVITYHKIKSAGIGGYLKSFLDPIFVMAPINLLSELFTPVSMACRHFGNILSGMVISALLYGALTALSHGLLMAIGENPIVAAVILAAGIGLILNSKRNGKKLHLVGGIVCIVLSVLSLLTNLGGLFADIPWLAVGIPAITGFYCSGNAFRIVEPFQYYITHKGKNTYA